MALELFSNTQYLIATIGASGLGFVLGWTLFFANRGKSGNLSTSDLAAIAGVVAGGAVTSLISKIGEDDALKAYVFGGYGIGLVLGFLVYFLLVWLAGNRRTTTGNPALDDALRSVQTGAAVAPARNAIPVTTWRNQTALGDTAMKDLESCLDSVRALIKDLSKAADSATDPEKRAQIKTQLRMLDEMSVKLNTGFAINFLSSPEVQAFLRTVQNETKLLNAEAEKMKKTAQDMNKVSKLIDVANNLIGSLKRIAA